MILQHVHHRDSSRETLYLHQPGGARRVARVTFEIDCKDLGTRCARGYFIHCIGTREGFRRRGLATRLLREVEKLARTAGRRMVYLLCDSSNMALQRFYAKRGFVPRTHNGAFWLMKKTLALCGREAA